MKKIKLMLAALIVFILVPSAVSAAPYISYGAGEWDQVGYSQTLLLKTNNHVKTQTVSSGGGNFQIRVTGSYYGQVYKVWLYEADGDKYTSIPSSPKYGYGDYTMTWDVSDYVDGTNGKAEIFAHIGYAKTEEYATLSFYD
ncbi:hypothetical protein NM897_17050 (plasmid) [Planococcus maritimus]|uniref:hypothetical protein n=1 Tax=Planococcus maritimus TaxID=192421 RepID=UPI0031393433